ncbi:ABC transporter permease [Pelomonas aquatica]|jgi:putative ABC transport system permease protein|uniref:FtsX-like permease family protein n=1 Tax=Pelomonas aquatica TaxID=431058 RepID=A0A9X4R6A9_9BURK|nr:FtsX-like permease family protein [Pelomonas aquatica]MCY4756061.1 ABC transporter permease [Pelomonas aquatica]MDG0864119.1 FtsX-like permease family protein [Pelomonas aquatica]
MSSSLTLPADPPRAGLGFLAGLRTQLSDLGPILSTLRRHRIAAGLIVLEVALSCAIVTNALHLIQTRLDHLGSASGLAESELVVLNVRGSTRTAPELVPGIVAQDLVRLRALPGVQAATSANQIVFGNNSNNSGVALEPGNKAGRIVASQYSGDEQLLPTFGLKLVEGRNFTPDEVLDGFKAFDTEEPRIGQAIISKAMAERLFPGRSALGQSIYVFGNAPTTVVGVVETLTHPQMHLARGGSGSENGNGSFAMLFPLRDGGSYVLRTEAGRRDAQIKAATAALEQADPSRVVTQARTLTEMRSNFYAQDRAMAWLMGGVCVALLLVTAMGIVGLASFWVQQRTRMIGTRRALGATEGQILRYFQLENLLLTTTGIVIGLAGAVALGQLLMQSYELPRLPWAYLPVGAVALWLLGQVAVWVPARRAARLSPVAALRS